MRSENLGHSLLLGFTEFREFRGNVGNRAMMLADLDSSKRSADSGSRRDVSSFGKRIGNLVCNRRDSVLIVIRDSLDSGQDRVDSTSSKRPYCFIATDLP
jgi:hypothetical protein